MMLYEKFRNSSLDTSPVGLISGPGRSNHVCTPSGAKIIAWSADREAIHFCHISGLGELVFAVDPSAPPGDCIHPVAENMLQFIGLLCTCRDASLISDAYRWSELFFNAKVASKKIGLKARSVLKALENIYHPQPIQDPYRCIIELQNSFDYTKLPLHAKYFEWCPVRPGIPQWTVSFDSNFADFCNKNDASKELAVTRQFQWNDENWCVPAIYLNENGIVVDSYLEMPAEKIQAFMEKWGSKSKGLCIEEKTNRDLENPLIVPAKGLLTVNNKSIACRKSFEVSWNPYVENPWNVRRTLEHYGLDRNKGYLLRRDCFLRKGNQNTIRTIEFALSSRPVSVPGPRFLAPDAGKSITFKHPETQTEHTLTVVSQIREALDPNFLSNHPCCYTRLHYTLTPSIHRDWFQVVDCDPGDLPYDADQTTVPTLPADKTPTPGHCAISSLRYTPEKQVQWQMLFRQKLRQNIQIQLLP